MTKHLAPTGCLQYHTSVSGQIFSFNFVPDNVRVSRQLSNQDYRVCVRPEENFCGVQYVACRDQAQVPVDGG